MQVDPWLSVSAAHNIGEAVRQQVHMHHPNVTESFVHIGLSCKALILLILRHANFCRCITWSFQEFTLGMVELYETVIS